MSSEYSRREQTIIKKPIRFGIILYLLPEYMSYTVSACQVVLLDPKFFHFGFKGGCRNIQHFGCGTWSPDPANDPSFNNTLPVDDPTKLRLKLLSVTEKGFYGGAPIEAKPYEFTYNEPGGMPAKTSFARDHWRYYNGVTGKTTLIPTFVTAGAIDDPVTHALGIMGNERNPNRLHRQPQNPPHQHAHPTPQFLKTDPPKEKQVPLQNTPSKSPLFAQQRGGGGE